MFRDLPVVLLLNGGSFSAKSYSSDEDKLEFTMRLSRTIKELLEIRSDINIIYMKVKNFDIDIFGINGFVRICTRRSAATNTRIQLWCIETPIGTAGKPATSSNVTLARIKSSFGILISYLTLSILSCVLGTAPIGRSRIATNVGCPAKLCSSTLSSFSSVTFAPNCLNYDVDQLKVT